MLDTLPFTQNPPIKNQFFKNHAKSPKFPYVRRFHVGQFFRNHGTKVKNPHILDDFSKSMSKVSDLQWLFGAKTR